MNPLEFDAITAQRRAMRGRRLWRLLAIAAVGIAATIIVMTITRTGGREAWFDQIARVQVDGFLTTDRPLLDVLDELAVSPRVKAVILHINTPGGEITSAEALYQAVRKIADEKPVVSVLGPVATSGGYLSAIAADQVIAGGNTITGSIGVILQWPHISEMLASLGVDVQTVRSSALKGEPNIFAPPQDGVADALQSMVDDSYRWFVGLVADRRKLLQADVARLADGRVYTGRQALAAGLIDGLGDEARALEWLGDNGVERGLQVVDWVPQGRSGAGIWSIEGASRLLAALGFSRLASVLKPFRHQDAAMLDGLVAVWHPSLAGYAAR